MISASDILTRCREARIRRWASDDQRERIEDYYNGGFLPSDGCGREIESLGLGNKELRRPHKLLRSTIEHDGGPVDVVVESLPDYERATTVKNALEKSMGEWCRNHYRTLCAQVAGEYLISGRAFAFRTSKWDIRFRFGRPLHESGASTDISDDSFMWWAFPYKLTLRDVDHFLKTARGEQGKGGWQKEGLRMLKRYLMLKPHDGAVGTVSSVIEDEPFDEGRLNEPLHCYVYFEKSAEKKGIHRSVNVRIVSRFTEKCSVTTLEDVDERARVRSVTKKLSLSYNNRKDEEGEDQVIFAQDNAFDSVFDCLIPWMEDARIAGEQFLDEVEGDGKQFLPRFAVMEELTESAVSGTAFAMRPNFTAGRDVPKRVAQRLQETGLPPFAIAPNGIGAMDKSGVISSSRAGLDLVQALGISIAEESSVNNMPQSMGKRSQVEFAAEAQMLLDSSQEAVTLRFTFWHAGWDLLWGAVGRTVQRVGGWAKADPSYWEVKAIHDAFVKAGGTLSELQKADMTFRSRRNPGGADRQTALQRFQLILQNPNAPAKWQQWAFSEAAKLLFGNEAVKMLDGGGRKPEKSQAERAILQTNAALSSFLPVAPDPADDPLLHLLEFHGPALVQRLQVCGAKGFRDASDTAAVSALVQHMAMDAMNLPGTARQGAEEQIRQAVAQFEAIPDQMPMDEAQIAQARLQLDQAKVQNQLRLGENLMKNRNAQLQMKAEKANFDMLANAKALGQQDRRISVEEQRAMAENPLLAG